MKTRVEFRSKKFPPYDGEEEEVNPGLWGKRLAEYLCEKLTAEGVETEAFHAEDWGWEVPVRNDAFYTFIGCGHQYGSDDTFLCFVEPSKPFVRRLFKKIDTTEQVGRVVAALEKILSADPDIRDVQWLNPDDM